MLDRPVLDGLSWVFRSKEAAEGSSLGRALFSVDGVTQIMLIDATVVVTRAEAIRGEWRPMAKAIGAVLRNHLQSGSSTLPEDWIDRIPDEEELRQCIAAVLDEEINPALASHAGHVALVGLKGNTVCLRMGGGCQGCSSAAATLKYGIENALRERVPMLGAILDETDHAAGSNPYYR